MIKKHISMALSFLLICSTVFAALTITASAAATNYITNGDFETALTNPIPNRIEDTDIKNDWGRVKSTVTRMERIEAADYTAADSVAQNGSAYLQSGTTTDKNGYIRSFGQKVDLTAGDYTLIFIARANINGRFFGGVWSQASTVTETPGLLGRAGIVTSAGWQSYSVSFTAASDATYYVLFGGNSADATNEDIFCLDNVALYKTADVAKLTLNTTSGGRVSDNSGYLDRGESVQITATPFTGYTFTGWSDGSTEATRTVVMNSDITLTANFTKAANYADYIIDGDFEDSTMKLSDFWTPISTNAGVVKQTATVGGRTGTFAKATGATTTSMALKGVQLTAGHTYKLTYDSYIATTVSGNGTYYYRAGFFKTGTTALGSASALASNSYANAYNSADVGTWTPRTIIYTPTTDVQTDLIIGFYNNECTSDWYVDNVVLYDTAMVCNITAQAGPGGTVTGGGTGILMGKPVTLTATPAENFVFDGWYNSADTKVSDTAVYSFAAAATETYTAKFKGNSTNLITDGDFEVGAISTNNLTDTSEQGVWGKVKSSVTLLSRVEAADYTEADSTNVNGNYYLQSGSAGGNYLRTLGQNVTLEANTDYQLTFIAKSSFPADIPIFGGVIQTNNHISMNTGVTTTSVVSVTPTDEWKLYTIQFNSGSVTSAVVAFGCYLNDVDTSYKYSIDNVKLEKASDVSIVGAPIANGNFESGNTNGWTTANGASFNTVTGQGWIIAQYLGTNAATLSGDAGANVTSPAFPVVAGETYELAFYSRHAGTTGQAIGIAVDNALTTGISLSGQHYENDATTPATRYLTVEGTTKTTYKTYTLQRFVYSFTAATTGNAQLTVSLEQDGAAVNVDDFTLYKRSDVTNKVQNGLSFNGVAIRATGVQGLRVKNSMNNLAMLQQIPGAIVVEYGTLAIRTALLNGEALVYDGTYTQAGGGIANARKGIAFSRAQGVMYQYAETVYGSVYAGVLINIPQQFYQENYTTRAYAVVRFADGTTTIAYGDEQEASIYDVATTIIAQGGETQAVRDHLQTNIIDVCNP